MDNHTEPTAAERASKASLVLSYYAVMTGSETEHSLSDLLADLAHHCDKQNLSLREALNEAESHYDEETNHQGTQFN